MLVHSKAINKLAPADYLLIEKEHKLLEKYLSDLRDACTYSNSDKLPDCQNCDPEKQASCQGRLPSFLFFIIELAAKHFDHEETIMLSRAHVTKECEFFRIHQQAHADILHKMDTLVGECFSLGKQSYNAKIYSQLYKKLSDMLEEHDRDFDDPFINFTKAD